MPSSFGVLKNRVPPSSKPRKCVFCTTKLRLKSPLPRDFYANRYQSVWRRFNVVHNSSWSHPIAICSTIPLASEGSVVSLTSQTCFNTTFLWATTKWHSMIPSKLFKARLKAPMAAFRAWHWQTPQLLNSIEISTNPGMNVALKISSHTKKVSDIAIIIIIWQELVLARFKATCTGVQARSTTWIESLHDSFLRWQQLVRRETNSAASSALVVSKTWSLMGRLHDSVLWSLSKSNSPQSFPVKWKPNVQQSEASPFNLSRSCYGYNLANRIECWLLQQPKQPNFVDAFENVKGKRHHSGWLSTTNSAIMTNETNVIAAIRARDLEEGQNAKPDTCTFLEKTLVQLPTEHEFATVRKHWWNRPHQSATSPILRPQRQTPRR